MSRLSHSAVVFDLGGVLLDLAQECDFREILEHADDEAMWRSWLESEWVRRFDRGECSAQEFAEGLVASYELDVTPKEFLEAFRRWPIGPYPGARLLVDALPYHLSVVCLSNTNALHWADQRVETDWRGWFDDVFVSHEMGRVKPDEDTFLHVVESLGVPAPEIVFLDDNAINVDAARGLGIDAHLVKGVAESRAVLESLGLLASR